MSDELAQGLDLSLDFLHDDVWETERGNQPFLNYQPPDNVISFELPRPRAHGSCRLFKHEVRLALRAVLDLPGASKLRQRLEDEAVRRCNDLTPGQRLALVGTTTLGATAWAIVEREKIIEDLGNKTYDIPLPIKELGIPGRLEIGVELENFEPVDYRIFYRLKIEF